MEEDPGVSHTVAAASSSSGSSYHASQAVAGSEAAPFNSNACGSGIYNVGNRVATPPPCSYEVNVKAIDGTVTKLHVPSNSSGTELKDLISKRLDVAPDKQRLIIRGHAIKDDDIIRQHVSDNGQTVHLVQRPDVPPSFTGQQAATSSMAQPQSASQPAAGLGPVSTAGLQVRFQLSASTPQEQQLATQLLFGGQGGNVGGSTEPNRGPSALGHVMLGQPLAAMALPASPIAVRRGHEPSGTPVVGSATAAARTLFDQRLASGVSADLVSALLGNALRPVGPESVAAPPASRDSGDNPGDNPGLLAAAVARHSEGQGESVASTWTAVQEVSRTTGVPPWSELRALNDQLARLLRREEESGGTLPQAHMPQGELHAFLGALHGACSQLGVGICDLQACVAAKVGDELRIQQMLRFADTAETAAALLQSVASHVRGVNCSAIAAASTPAS